MVYDKLVKNARIEKRMNLCLPSLQAVIYSSGPQSNAQTYRPHNLTYLRSVVARHVRRHDGGCPAEWVAVVTAVSRLD